MCKRFFVLAVAMLATFAVAQDAKIKVGDRLRMTCEEEPTLNKEYSVTAQGVILVDFIGAVHVEGNTEKEAERIVSARLVDERILRRATITVRIVNSAIATVTYRGAVQSTGQEPHRNDLRLSDIVKKARPRDDTDLARIEVRSRRWRHQVLRLHPVRACDEREQPAAQAG